MSRIFIAYGHHNTKSYFKEMSELNRLINCHEGNVVNCLIDIANFATGSAFKPYITTVGLHDDDGNLLVVGKLGQPIKASSETDTTFVIRFDT